ncbi:MAG: phage tail family protein [Patescibacteria group bacterium]|nr:phage tail family protein [Patescibacteria group bacterium]
MAGTTLFFDNNNLQTANIITQSIDHASIPQKDAKLYALAHASASTIPFTSYPSKMITVTGRIFHDTVEQLDDLLDTFRGYFTNTGANLDIGYNNATRRYIATVNSLTVDRPGGLTYADFKIEFVATQPFGQSTTPLTLVSASGRTAATYTDLVTFSGTAPWQRPVVTITYTTVSGNGSINFGNNANGQQLTISGARAAGDVITLDVSKKSVQVNYVDYPFTGAFPEFPPGPQSMSYSDALGSRNLTYNVSYYPLYL